MHACMHASNLGEPSIFRAGREESRKEGTRLVCRVTYSKWYLPKNIFFVFSLCVFLLQPALHGVRKAPLFTFYGYWLFILSYLKSHRDASDGVVPAKHLCFRRRKRWEPGRVLQRSTFLSRRCAHQCVLFEKLAGSSTLRECKMYPMCISNCSHLFS